MIYSEFDTDRIASPMYEKVAKQLLSLTKDEEENKKVRRYII